MDINSNNSVDQVFYKALKYLVIFAPVIVYLAYVQQYALNLPRQDDYDAALDYLIQFKKAGAGDRFFMLFAQHNEHRIFLSNVFCVVYYFIFGVINFRNILFANAIIFFLFYLICFSFIKRALPVFWPIAALALSLCIFDIDGWENANIAVGGAQVYGVIFLFGASIYFYNKEGNLSLLLAVLLQGATVFSSGNGNAGSFFIMLFVLLTGNRKKKLVAFLSFLVFAPLYFIHYNKGAAVFMSLDPSKFIPFFLHSVGAHFSFTLGVVMGVVIILGYLYVFPFKSGNGFKIKENTAFFLVLAAFCFASLGTMSVFRAQLPIVASHASRYFIYSQLIVAVLFVLLLMKLENNKYQFRVATVGLLVLMGLYRKNYNDGIVGFETHYKITRYSQYDYPEVAKDRARQITEEACREKIYCLEEARAAIK